LDNLLSEKYGPFPSPDRVSGRWQLYDYRTLNGYFKVELSDSIWRGIVQLGNPLATPGVYYCGFPPKLPKEQVLASLTDGLRKLRESTEFLLPSVEPVLEVELQQPVKLKWWQRLLKWCNHE
jgi:hypothetical protein